MGMVLVAGLVRMVFWVLNASFSIWFCGPWGRGKQVVLGVGVVLVVVGGGRLMSQPLGCLEVGGLIICVLSLWAWFLVCCCFLGWVEGLIFC